MVTILHISDPHFGTEQAPVVEALVRLATAQQPDVLVLSGDITQRAKTVQFAAARAFCDRLPIAHRISLPGNHDIPLLNIAMRLLAPYQRYQKAFGHALEPVLDLPEVCVLAVKTTRRWRHVNGEISAQQVARVAARLRLARPAQLRIVMLHQPIHVMQSSDAHDQVIGWRPAVNAWREAGADMVLGGHIHMPFFARLGEESGVGVVGMPGMWCVQAGTATSSRVRSEAPNSVNLLRYGTSTIKPGPVNCCTLERWDYAANKGEFVCHQTTVLPLRR